MEEYLMRFEIPLKNPKPDFDSMAKLISGEKKPDRVFIAELLVDEEIKKAIIEKYFKEKNVAPPREQRFGGSEDEGQYKSYSEYKSAYELYHKELIKFYYRMGYHFIPDLEFYLNFSSLNKASRIGSDTAIYSRGERYWAQEGFGMIRNWEDFEKFPWDKAKKMLDGYGEHLEFLSKNLPEGMKIASQAAVYEPVMEWLFGYEGLFYTVIDDFELVKAVTDTLAELVYKSYEIAAQIEGVGVIWHGDDLGYKTGTMLSPQILRKLLFPWYKKYGEIAKKYGKPYWYHCCGNKSEIMEDLIDFVKIDGLHAFEDGCCPVVGYKQKYGERLGMIGGVDIDKLVRLQGNELRKYLVYILDSCMPGGRYVFGSGNSICNFIPLENYMLMIEVGQNWGK
jgi:uroporphyrinogen decarboxylase